MKKVSIVIVVLLMLAIPLVSAQEDGLPDLILAANPGMHPEGIEWDSEGERFLVGSITQGTIFAVDDEGNVQPFVEDDNLMASIGIHIDHANGVLLVANSDFAVTSDQNATGVAQLGAYDLETGEQIYFADMTGLTEGRNFTNDVTSDTEGNAYVTNSFAPVIYKVDPEGNAEIFIENEQLGAQGFGLNGIDFHPHEYLLAAVAGTQSLFKIPLDDPESLTQVELSEPLGIDGMVLNDEGHLVTVATNSEGVRRVYELSSDDEWATAMVVASGDAMPDAAPTTVALRDGSAYVVHAHFGEIGADEPVQEFEIMRVELVSEDMDDEMGEEMDDDSDDDMADDEMGDDDTDDGDDDDAPDAEATEEVSG